MSRIVHIALKCADNAALDASTRFYEEVFGIYVTKNEHKRGHSSRHMTDGNIDLALMVYDSEEEKEAKLAGAGPRIHHIGVEVEDRPSMIKKIEDNGGTIFSDKAEGALKYHSPDGTLGEIVGLGRYFKKERSALGRIAHVGFNVEDPAKARQFYENVYGMKHVRTVSRGGQTSCLMSDGETDLELIRNTDAATPGANWAGGGPCIHHWGIEVPDAAAAAAKITALGGVALTPGGANAPRFRCPDGNVLEIRAAGGYGG